MPPHGEKVGEQQQEEEEKTQEKPITTNLYLIRMENDQVGANVISEWERRAQQHLLRCCLFILLALRLKDGILLPSLFFLSLLLIFNKIISLVDDVDFSSSASLRLMEFNSIYLVPFMM